jgi:DNA polymerase-1
MHLLLVDGSGYIFRAFHALPPLSRKSDGLPVGCVQGFCNMLYKLTQDMDEGDEPPTHMAVIFDAKGKTFRDDLYPQYKAQRPPAPEELVPQFPLTRSATRAFSIPSIEMEGWEADDIMATYAVPGARCRLEGHHRLVRQGPDATRRARWLHPPPRHHPPPRPAAAAAGSAPTR